MRPGAEFDMAGTGFTVFVIVSLVMLLLGWAYWEGYSDGRVHGREQGRETVIRRKFAYWRGFADGRKQGRQQ
jgi:DNA-binding transcriptional regulator of glucitol operon